MTQPQLEKIMVYDEEIYFFPKEFWLKDMVGEHQKFMSAYRKKHIIACRKARVEIPENGLFVFGAMQMEGYKEEYLPEKQQYIFYRKI